MAVDPALPLFAKPIEQGQPWPRPACPTCGSGFVRFDKPASSESWASASVHDHEAFEPEWITGTFVARGECENPECRQAVHATGDYSVNYAKEPWDYSYQAGPYYSEYYAVATIHPALAIMPIPAAAPEQVREGIKRASRVLFADPGLAATALRATVERFLTVEGIAAQGADGKFLSAHARIQEWSSADPDRPQVADLLFAVKWLGNAGTHEDSDLTAIEVLDGARVLDEAFHRLFTGPDIEAHARSINSNKGPVREP